MTGQEEKIIQTGSYGLQCLECRFKQTFLASPTESMDDVNKKTLKVCKTHFKNLKHKKMLVIISTYDVIEYDGLNNNYNLETTTTTKEEEANEKADTTGCHTLRCFDCEFTETIWGDINDKNAEAVDAHIAHCKRFKHKKGLLTTTSYWIAEYNGPNNDITCKPAPKNEL